MLKGFYAAGFYLQDVSARIKLQTVQAKLAQHIFLFLGMDAMIQNVVLAVLFKNGVMAGANCGAVGAG